MTILGLLFARWLRSRRAEHLATSDVSTSTSGVLAAASAPVNDAATDVEPEAVAEPRYRPDNPFADLIPAPAAQIPIAAPAAEQPSALVASTLYGAGEAVHVWGDADIAFELFLAQRWEPTSPGAALWHRRRARAIAQLIQQQDVAESWFHVEHLLCDRPTRMASFSGGPLDGSQCRVTVPPATLRVARRPDGNGLAGAYLVQEVSPALEREPECLLPRAPREATIIGSYRWSEFGECFEWSGAAGDAP